MQIGLLLAGLGSAAESGRIAAEAEALGFDSLWAGDHIAFPAPIVDPLQLLACFASHTHRVRLGTCVYLLPLRHPTPIAKMVASLDFVSGGRVIFGVGVGGEFPNEFQACGVPVGERGARANEAITVLRTLWKGDKAGHTGRFFSFDPVQLKPPPVQAGGPPIWVGGRSDAALRRTARFGDGYVGYMLGADGFSERMERIRALAREPNAGGRPLSAALMTFAIVDRDRSSALDTASSILGAMYGRDMRNAAARYCVVGTPDECRLAVERYAQAGVEHLILAPLAYGGGVLEQIRAVAGALAVEAGT